MNELAMVFDRMDIDKEVIDAMNTKWNARLHPALLEVIVLCRSILFIYEAEN